MKQIEMYLGLYYEERPHVKLWETQTDQDQIWKQLSDNWREIGSVRLLSSVSD
jgi:hypothetical protein